MSTSDRKIQQAANKTLVVGDEISIRDIQKHSAMLSIRDGWKTGWERSSRSFTRTQMPFIKQLRDIDMRGQPESVMGAIMNNQDAEEFRVWS